MRRHPNPPGRTEHDRRRRSGRQLKLEGLEPRLVLTSLTLDQAFGELSGHGGACPCPICTGVGLSSIPSQESSSAGPSAAPLSSLPQLHSNPGATAKLFLDFDGHFQSNWGGFTNITTPAFSQDADTASFTDPELAAIQEIWARVAEDYAPFNVDVTTVDTGNQTNLLTALIAIGGSYSDWYGSSAGGVAYIGGFYNSASNVGYVFENNLSSHARFVAEASSHEAGHLFGLRHQSVWSGSSLIEPYNDGDSNLAPIMGSAYSAARSIWFNGTTDISNSSFQNDVAVLAGSANGFGQKTDDFGNTIPFASELPATGTSVSLSGLIEHNADVDLWEFVTTGGQVSFTLAVAQFGPNLDAIMELRDESDNILFSSAPTNSFGASITATLAAGTYFLAARSNGVYGNIGQYSINGTIPEPAPAPEINLLVGGGGVSDGGSVSFESTPVGTAASRTFTVTNDGDATLNLTALDPASMPAGFTLTSNLSSTTLAPGQSTTFTVRLDAASVGDFAGEIQLASDDADENPYNLFLSGAVTALPEISLFADGSGIGTGVYVDYGSTNVGAPLTRTYTVRNDGGGTLNLTTLNASAMPAGFTLTSNLSDLTLLNGETATFTVRLDATSAGSFQGQIQVASGDADESPFVINVLGSVISAPEITLTENGANLTDGSSLAFGTTTVGAAVTRTITVANDGNATLNLAALDPGAMPAGFTLVSNLGSTSLAPGASTTFVIRLDASAAGSYSGAIALANGDSNENPFDLTISGAVNDPDAWTGPKIIDNGASGWTKVGSWTYVTGKGRDNDIHRTAKGSGTIQANWTFTNLPSAQYWVWASWTGNLNNASNAPFSVYNGTQAIATWRVDQRGASTGFDADGTSWRYLGMVTIASGQMMVRLTNAANNYVVADAVRMDQVFSGAALAEPTALPAGGSGRELVVLPTSPALSSGASTPLRHSANFELPAARHNLDAYFAQPDQVGGPTRIGEPSGGLLDLLARRGRDDQEVDRWLTEWDS